MASVTQASCDIAEAQPDILERCLFVVARQRSGTTVLRRTLATHAAIRDLGEIMHERRKGGFYTELASTIAANPGFALHSRWFDILLDTVTRMGGPVPEPLLLVDIKYNMALSLGTSFRGPRMVSTFAQEMMRRQGRVLHLVRRNKLALIVSQAMARATQQWELRRGHEPRHELLTLDTHALGQRILEEEAMDSWFARQFARIEGTTTLVYEELFDQHGAFAAGTLDRITERFGLPPCADPMPRLTRQGRPLRECLSNHAALVERIAELVREGRISPDYLRYAES